MGCCQAILRLPLGLGVGLAAPGLAGRAVGATLPHTS